MRVALLGTGTMGAPMARHLARAGHEVRVWNRTRAKAEEVGATVAGRPAAAVAGVEVVITMLADGPSVAEVMRDVLPVLTAGAIWVQMSTVGAEWADRLTALAAKHDVDIVDAPVMGSRPQAEEGKLVPLVSGPERACTVVAPLFEAFSRDVLWLGSEPGMGSRLKLVANHWILNSVENLAQTIAFADALELDPRRFLELISGAPFDMQYAHWKGALMLERDFPASFALKLARKDMRLALAAAADAHIELALAEATERRMGEAVDAGYGEADNASTYLVARKQPPKSGTGRAT
jgi:3-hydroxyisobutyrate dehydrogenase